MRVLTQDTDTATTRLARLTHWLRAVHTAAYLDAKGVYLGRFSVVATFIAALFVISNLAWDYAIDPGNMGSVAWIRLFQTASVILLGAIMLANPAHNAHSSLKRDAETDTLTGIPNRRCFLRVGEHLVERAALERRPMSVIFIDVDHFKAINDDYGHICGDHLLRQIAARIERCTRIEDLATRFGGEEFAIILPGADAATARMLAEKICEQVAERPFQGPNGTDHAIPVTVSVGLASAAPAMEAVTLQELTRRADDAAYRAKRAGRHRVEIHQG